METATGKRSARASRLARLVLWSAAMERRALGPVLLSVLLSVGGLSGCGEDEAESEVDTTDHVGLYEIPISRSNQATEPRDAVRIEISPTEMRLNYEPVLELERGLAPDGAVNDHVITALREAIGSGAARSRAALRIHTNVPYLTLAQTMNTLRDAGLRELFIAVRTPGETPQEAWMQMPHWQILPPGDEPATFEGRAPRWDEFVAVWRDVYDRCRAGDYVDCDGPYSITAEGGELDIEMWTRARAMKVTFRQINPPEPEPSGGGGGGGLIEGVAAAPVAANPEEEEDPATAGAFTMQHMESVAEDSHISSFMEPVCADTQCRVTFVTDATTASMRVISFVGAAFPNGSETPQIAFRMPVMQ